MTMNMDHMMMKKRTTKKLTEEERVHVVDLNGMSLDSLPPKLSIDLGIICTLDLSNNNLQVLVHINLTFSFSFHLNCIYETN